MFFLYVIVINPNRRGRPDTRRVEAQAWPQRAWKISAEDVAARGYNLDMKNPHQGKEISHNPDELLVNYIAQQDAIQSLRDQLKDILSDALGKGT